MVYTDTTIHSNVLMTVTSLAPTSINTSLKPTEPASLYNYTQTYHTTEIIPFETTENS